MTRDDDHLRDQRDLEAERLAEQLEDEAARVQEREHERLWEEWDRYGR
jgi:hypothetical protein